ncbi:hypothetical protein BpHYR1_007861 [Brachionus plicatilis]|uniref:Uncharacterized protein n=1 Tax=Brachionus plicatilis TaxID=10195 RepID=A0A3M7STF9_BRAPC|nr:hypothetical protein BpHYR1_007861 [Brachionus plicatilis]
MCRSNKLYKKSINADGDLIQYDHNSSIAHVQIVDPYNLELLFFFLPLYNSLQSMNTNSLVLQVHILSQYLVAKPLPCIYFQIEHPSTDASGKTSTTELINANSKPQETLSGSIYRWLESRQKYHRTTNVYFRIKFFHKFIATIC